MSVPIPPEVLTVFEWIKGEWAAIAGAGGIAFSVEKWRGQRLANKKLRLENQKLDLEVRALSLALRKEELQRLAREITGKDLPDTDDPAAAFRAVLEEWAKGRAIAELHTELDELKDRLAESEEALAEFSCPYCGAPLSERLSVPLGGEHNDSGTAESYECGYSTSDVGDSSPCPSDPKFPKLDEFDLVTRAQERGNWTCWAKPLTANARRLALRGGFGRTEQEAIEHTKSEYERRATKRKWNRR